MCELDDGLGMVARGRDDETFQAQVHAVWIRTHRRIDDVNGARENPAYVKVLMNIKEASPAQCSTHHRHLSQDKIQTNPSEKLHLLSIRDFTRTSLLLR